MAWLRVTDPRGRTRLEALEGDRSVLGRSTSCDIPVDDPDVGLRHVSVLRTERGYLIVAESDSLPIWKDDERVSNTFLEDGADYRIGSTTLRFVERTTEGIAADDLGSAATVMGEAEPSLPPRGQTLLGPPNPDRTPSSSPTMKGVVEASTEDDADAPDSGSTTQVQGSGTTAEEGDSTRTVSPGPPVPSSTPTLQGKSEPASKTEVARPRPHRPGTTPPWKTQPPLPRTGRTVMPSSTPAPPALQLLPRQRTAPPVPRPNPEGSTPTLPPTQPPIERSEVLDESESESEPNELAGSIEPPDAITVDLPIESVSEPIELADDNEPDAVPPVRFPPPPEDGSKSTHSWVWRKGDEPAAKSRDSVYSLGPSASEGEVHRSSESWGWGEGQARPEGRAELEPEVDLPPGGPKKGLEAPIRPQSSQPPPPPASPSPPVEPVRVAPPPPPSPPSPPSPPEPQPEPVESKPEPPEAKPARPRVEPVLLPARRDDEPPLPRVSKELSSGHSWMWALPQSLRDGSDPARRSRGSDPLVVAGVVLLIIGAGLIGIAFAFGLTTDVIAKALGGRA